MVALVTLNAAKEHLRLDDADQDEEVEARIGDASDIIVDYLKRPNHGWTDQTVPGQVRAAVLLVLGSLWVNRDAVGDAADQDPISPAVVSLLRRMRDPALA